MRSQQHQKVVLIGDSSSGKTSLMYRLMNNHFRQSYTPTVGVDSGNYVVSDGRETSTLKIWDTAGQERYRSLGNIFYQNADGAILVVDQQKPFDQSSAEGWVRDFRKVVGDDPVIVVAIAKCDLDEVSKQEIFQWSETHGYTAIETSSKTGFNVKVLFQFVSMTIRKNIHMMDTVTSTPHAPIVDCSEKVRTCC